MQLPVEHFAERLKGKRLVEALVEEFPQLDEGQRAHVVEATRRFELSMNLPLVPGVLDFIGQVKAKGYKTGLVTSSIEPKMEVALDKLGLAKACSTRWSWPGASSAASPTRCAICLQRATLGVPPADCIVFEDSLAGVQAGLAAGMTVIGVATTLPRERLLAMTPYVISDFQNGPLPGWVLKGEQLGRKLRI